MNRRLIVLLLPFILALFVLLPRFIPPTIAARPDLVEEMTLPVAAAAINLNDNLFQPARLTTQNQGVFGPNCTTTLGDPFSPFNSTLRPPNHYVNPAYNSNYFTYRYRIDIPDNYETATNSNIVRVELFDADSYNYSQGHAEIDTTFYLINHTQPHIGAGNPPTTTQQCPLPDQRRSEACVLTTGEPQTYNPTWFIRVDEIRAGNGTNCNMPTTYNSGNRTQTGFDLYYHRINVTSGAVEPVPISQYIGREDNLHDTDLRWVSPGGGLSYDQNISVPSNFGSFEVNLTAISDVLPDPITGLRTIYLDVTALTGASENGFDVWAGPPSYTVPANPGDPCQGGLPSRVNARNVHITNCGNASHSSGGVTIAALDYQLTNYNTTAPIEKKLVYIGPEYAGETIHVTLFDSDSGAQSPLLFYFDTLAFTLRNPIPTPPANPINTSLTDWFRAFAVNNTVTHDPDLLPGESRNCYPGTCNNTWITPTYRIQVPTLSPTLCVNPVATPHYCTPFYGGWLTVRYLPGYHDTATWHVELPERPLVDTTATCPGVFPVTMPDSVHSMTADDYLIAFNTPSNERYPATLPIYSDFLAHTADISLDQAEEGDIFLFVGEGYQIDNYGFLQWNTDTSCPGCNQAHTRLQNSLSWPGNVLDPLTGFHEVGDWGDTRLQVNDRVAISPADGAVTSSVLSSHINRGRTLQFLSWSITGVLPGGGPGGSDVPYARASQFINFRILGYKLVGGVSDRWLLAEFMGRGTNCGQLGPDISFAESSYSVSESSALVPLMVQLSYALANTVTVSYTTSDGTATAGQDYAAATGLLTFPPGTISQTLPISILDDLNLESNETFSVTLSNPMNGNIINVNPVPVTIIDNDSPSLLSFTVSALAVSEGNGTATVIVQQNGTYMGTVNINYATSDGTATAGQDYTTRNGTMIFSPGVISRTLSIPILNDTLLEGDEAFFVTLSNPVNGVITGTNPLPITITDDESEAEVGFVVTSLTVAENEGTAQVVVQQNGVHGNPVQVNVATSNGTATAGLDYTAINTILTFNPGVLTQTVSIPILNDSLLENSETLALTLSDPVNAVVVGTNPIIITIEDDEEPAEISFAAATLTVPETAGQVQVVIQQNQAHTSPLSVFVSTSDGTATAGQDYTPTGGTINFNGAAAITITIQLNNDTLPEGHETFFVTLANPFNGTIISINPLQIIILDDECLFAPVAAPGRIEAEDFTCGSEGVAYHDSTPGNQGTSSYRFGEDVDVWNSAAASQARYVGNTVAGEWLVYTLVVTETGRYDLSLAFAGTVPSQVRVEIDGVDVTGVLILPGTSGGETFVEVAAAVDLLLTAGVYQVRLFIISGGANLDYLTFSPTPPDLLYLPLMVK